MYNKYCILNCRHYSVPLMPKVKGLNDFKGHVLHSHDYRVPAPYKDKTVVCLGAGASGQDISLDIASLAKKVLSIVLVRLRHLIIISKRFVLIETLW